MEWREGYAYGNECLLFGGVMLVRSAYMDACTVCMSFLIKGLGMGRGGKGREGKG